jgi:very-short-patch-repair endonuclease
MLARRQERLVTRAQLVACGYGAEAIRHRIAVGRLHPIRPEVYAVGAPWITRRGERFAAVLALGTEAAASHEMASVEWGFRPDLPTSPFHVTIPPEANRRPPGITVHRRALPPQDITTHRHMPVTGPVRTLLDLATALTTPQLERAVNEADRLDLVDPESLRRELQNRTGQPGVRPLRDLLDRQTFRLTDSELERRFLRIAARAGLPTPETQALVNGFRVDFWFPALGLVVETDGLRYHRTPARQLRDARRDQGHALAGLTVLRFPHAQIRFEARAVERTLATVARRLASAA